MKKKERLVGLLKQLSAKVPRRMMAQVTARFQEIEKVMKVKTTCLEEVDEQRRCGRGCERNCGGRGVGGWGDKGMCRCGGMVVAVRDAQKANLGRHERCPHALGFQLNDSGCRYGAFPA